MDITNTGSSDRRRTIWRRSPSRARVTTSLKWSFALALPHTCTVRTSSSSQPMVLRSAPTYEVPNWSSNGLSAMGSMTSFISAEQQPKQGYSVMLANSEVNMAIIY